MEKNILSTTMSNFKFRQRASIRPFISWPIYPWKKNLLSMSHQFALARSFCKAKIRKLNEYKNKLFDYCVSFINFGAFLKEKKIFMGLFNLIMKLQARGGGGGKINQLVLLLLSIGLIRTSEKKRGKKLGPGKKSGS